MRIELVLSPYRVTSPLSLPGAFLTVMLMACGARSSGGPTDAGLPTSALDSSPVLDVSAIVDAPAQSAGPLRVFVTARGFSGNFTQLSGESNGLIGADVLCTRAANSAGMSGRFVAYLSDYSEARGVDVRAWDRVVGSGPWVSVGSGDVIFQNRAALMADELPGHRLLRTERGELIDHTGLAPASPTVWTGSRASAADQSDDTCVGWTQGRGPSGGLLPGSCGCLGEHCQSADWREHRYGRYPGVCYCENPPPYENDHPRLYCFEVR